MGGAADWLIGVDGISEGLKECLSRSRDTWSRGGGGRYPIPLQAALFGGLKLGTLSTANCALVPFMNIHSGVFRPRLISREIEEETRTFYHKKSPPPSFFFLHSQGDAGKIAQVH